MADQHLTAQLLYKHLQGTLTEQEQKQLEQWLQASAENRLLLEELEHGETLASRLAEFHPDNKTALRNRILQQVSQATAMEPGAGQPARIRPLYKWGWAAAAVLLLAAGAYLWVQPGEKAAKVAAVQHEILPGSDRAVLTLANGAAITLNSAGNQVIRQEGAAIQQQGGQLTYATQGGNFPAAYNVLSTPRGGQFRVTLPDGTRVWLNAASSLRYPTAFTGTERKVELTGEAYFEVAKHAGMPFRVSVNNRAAIEVLGTRFNVNAYEDESRISTTLLQGKVKVAAGGAQQAVLMPGQQAQIAGRHTGIIIVSNADVDKALAWKNGLFNFEGATLEEVMKQLERWYDIEVIYEKGIPDIAFGGKMTRDIPLSGVLIALEKSKVHFRVEGRRLIVLP
jgi:ferric-dicitrate binding protein FerR (iron transport regulator)